MKRNYKLLFCLHLLISFLSISSCANNDPSNRASVTYADLANDFAKTYQRENTIRIDQKSLSFLNSSMYRTGYEENKFYDGLNKDQQNYLDELTNDYKSAMTKRDKKETKNLLSNANSIVKITKLKFNRWGYIYFAGERLDYSCSLKKDYLVWNLANDNLLKSCHTDSLIKPRPTMYYNLPADSSINSTEDISAFVDVLKFDESKCMKVSLNDNDYANYLTGDDYDRSITNGDYLEYFEIEYVDNTIETLIVDSCSLQYYKASDPQDIICRVYKFVTPTIFYETCGMVNHYSLVKLFY